MRPGGWAHSGPPGLASSGSNWPTRPSGWLTFPVARQRTVAVLGHEQTGIPPEGMELLDVAVEIPMIGIGASLNVAVAGSLVLYRLAGFL
jgi:tRNA G18 (ribose-2'-O)-methylase SpoU